MLNYSKWKGRTFLGMALVILAVGSLTLFERSAIDKWLASLPVFRSEASFERLGGTQLLLELDVYELRHNLLLKPLAHDARAKLREVKIFYDGRPAVVGDSVRVRVRLTKPEDIDRAYKALQSLGNDLKITKEPGGLLVLTPTKAGMQALMSKETRAAIAIIRQRIDALDFGCSIPTRRQGKNRILVQLPGLLGQAQGCSDQLSKLKRVIGAKAKLSFRFVHPTMTAVEARAARIPRGYIILPSDESGEELVQDHDIIDSLQFSHARASSDPVTGEPMLYYKIHAQGARKTEGATRRNIGRRLAIVLDNGSVTKRDSKGKKLHNEEGHEIRVHDMRVLTAPIIHSAIAGGSGQIRGNFSREKIETLAIQLNSGSLPASLILLEERTVAPNPDPK